MRAISTTRMDTAPIAFAAGRAATRRGRRFAGLLPIALTLGALALPPAHPGAMASPPAGETIIIWGPEQNPHIILADFVVGSGELLRILPGTEVRLGPDVSLILDGGRLEALGNERYPILFTWHLLTHPWGALRFTQSEDNRISHALIEHGSHSEEYLGAMIEVRSESSIEMERCELHAPTHAAFWAFESDFVLQECDVHDCERRGVVSGLSTGTVRGCEVRNVSWDGLEHDGGEADSHVVSLLDNFIHDIGDDGIDLDTRVVAVVSGNRITDCADKGVSVSTNSAATLTNNIVAGCESGLVSSIGAQTAIANCTVYDCDYGVRTFDDYGGRNTTLSARNLIVWESGIDAVEWGEFTFVSITYSDLDCPFPGQGNLCVDPRFVDPAAGDFHLRPGSPCIDAGTSDPPAPEQDFEGDSRVDDPNVPNSGGGSCRYYDIGVDERVPGSLGVAHGRGTERGLSLRPLENPSGAVVRVALTLVRGTPVQVGVFDPLGRRVRALRHGWVSAGAHTLSWDRRDEDGAPCAAGVYFLRATSRGGETSVRVVLR